MALARFGHGLHTRTRLGASRRRLEELRPRDGRDDEMLGRKRRFARTGAVGLGEVW